MVNSKTKFQSFGPPEVLWFQVTFKFFYRKILNPNIKYVGNSQKMLIGRIISFTIKRMMYGEKKKPYINEPMHIWNTIIRGKAKLKIIILPFHYDLEQQC